MNRVRLIPLVGAALLGGLVYTSPAAAQAPFAGTPVVSEMQGRRADIWAWARIPYYQNYFSPYYFDTPAYARDDGFGLWGVDYPLFGYPPRHASPPTTRATVTPSPKYYSPGNYVSPGAPR